LISKQYHYFQTLYLKTLIDCFENSNLINQVILDVILEASSANITGD